MQKIEKGTHNKTFDWLLESERHACESNGNSDMIRELVKEHNTLVDELKNLKKEIKKLSGKSYTA